MRSIGVHALFMFTAGVHFLVGCFALHRLTQRTAVIDEDRPAFSESVVMSQTILEIDPMESDSVDGNQTPTATQELEKPQ